MEAELERFHKQNAQLEINISDLKQKHKSVENELIQERQATRDVESMVRRFKTDLFNCVGSIQDPKVLKNSVIALYKKHIHEDLVSLKQFPPDLNGIWFRCFFPFCIIDTLMLRLYNSICSCETLFHVAVSSSPLSGPVLSPLNKELFWILCFGRLPHTYILTAKFLKRIVLNSAIGLSNMSYSASDQVNLTSPTGHHTTLRL